MVETTKLHNCDGCYKGPFLEKALTYEYGLLLCPGCIRLTNKIHWRERITQWLEILKELVK